MPRKPLHRHSGGNHKFELIGEQNLHPPCAGRIYIPRVDNLICILKCISLRFEDCWKGTTSQPPLQL